MVHKVYSVSLQYQKGRLANKPLWSMRRNQIMAGIRLVVTEKAAVTQWYCCLKALFRCNCKTFVTCGSNVRMKSKFVSIRIFVLLTKFRKSLRIYSTTTSFAGAISIVRNRPKQRLRWSLLRRQHHVRGKSDLVRVLLSLSGWNRVRIQLRWRQVVLDGTPGLRFSRRVRLWHRAGTGTSHRSTTNAFSSVWRCS